MDKEFEQKVNKMITDKRNEMIVFLNRHLSPEERNRIGEDIVRIMPNEGDVAKIKLNLL